MPRQVAELSTAAQQGQQPPTAPTLTMEFMLVRQFQGTRRSVPSFCTGHSLPVCDLGPALCCSPASLPWEMRLHHCFAPRTKVDTNDAGFQIQGSITAAGPSGSCARMPMQRTCRHLKEHCHCAALWLSARGYLTTGLQDPTKPLSRCSPPSSLTLMSVGLFSHIILTPLPLCFVLSAIGYHRGATAIAYWLRFGQGLVHFGVK